MQITDPNSSSTILTSNDIYESSCGLYLTNYPTTVTGNYTINVQANTGNGIVNFATYFTVLDYYDYDIIRNTDSKIDPFNNPNDNDVEIDITSFVGDKIITIKEFVPSSFGIFNTDATVETVGDEKILTWVRTPQNGLVDTIFCFINSTDHPSGFQKSVFSLSLLKPSTTVDHEIKQLVSL